MSKRGLLRSLYDLLRHNKRIVARGEIIKQDEEKRAKCIKFGCWAIFQSLLFATLWILSVLGIKVLIEQGNELFITVAVAIGVLFGAISGIYLIISTTTNMIVQLKVNRRFVGWLALIVEIVAIVGTLVFAILQLLAL